MPPRPSLPRRALNRLAEYSARTLPLAALRALIPRPLIGFFYHAVSDNPPPHLRHLYPIKSTAEFEADLRWLKAHAKVIGLAEIKAHFLHNAPLPKHAAFLSFDDGFSLCYDVIRPILLEHNQPAVFFLTTDWIDNQRMYYRGKVSLAIDALTSAPPEGQTSHLQNLANRFDFHPTLPAFTTWIRDLQPEQVATIDEVCTSLGVDIDAYLASHQPFLTRSQIHTMQQEGFSFGAHSRRHTKLVRLSPEEQEAEIVESCRIVADITGQDQVPFAFPFSGNGVDRQLLRQVQQHPEVGLIFDTQKLRLEPDVIHRIWADKPVPGVPPESNLEHWLRDACSRALAERILR